MKRIRTTARTDWQGILAGTGRMHEGGWREDAYYQLSPMDAKEINIATTELQMLTLQAAQHVIDRNLLGDLGIPPEWHGIVKESWKRRDPYLLGRLDLAFDGLEPPKLIEYNADSMNLIIETAWLQTEWLLAKFPDGGYEQFAELQDLLPARFKEILTGQHLHMTCYVDDKEALSNTIYVREMANNGGCTTTDIDVKSIGWDSAKRAFVDMDNKKIETFCKFYPWDWILREQFGTHFNGDTVRVVEPAWKLMLTSKAILKILWKLFPNHPNLLPASDTPLAIGRDYVKKPVFGRAGLNVTIHKSDEVQSSAGRLETEKFIYQGVAPIPIYDGKYPIVSSFIVGDKPAGIAVREDDQMISSRSAAFVPHVIYADPK